MLFIEMNENVKRKTPINEINKRRTKLEKNNLI